VQLAIIIEVLPCLGARGILLNFIVAWVHGLYLLLRLEKKYLKLSKIESDIKYYEIL
jgi:hypothetical protein